MFKMHTLPHHNRYWQSAILYMVLFCSHQWKMWRSNFWSHLYLCSWTTSREYLNAVRKLKSWLSKEALTLPSLLTPPLKVYKKIPDILIQELRFLQTTLPHWKTVSCFPTLFLNYFPENHDMCLHKWYLRMYLSIQLFSLCSLVKNLTAPIDSLQLRVWSSL